jgi:hypothetical protein
MKQCISVFVLILILILIFSAAVKAQENIKPCTQPEASQLDFWLGEWNAEWTNADGTKGTGTNRITKILGSCTVQENFCTADNSFIGMSVSVYSPVLKKWQQTWVDNNGGYMDFTGEYENGKMTLAREFINKDGMKVMNRMVFYNITKESFDWNWESSKDNGATWSLMWKIKYTRKS